MKRGRERTRGAGSTKTHVCAAVLHKQRNAARLSDRMQYRTQQCEKKAPAKLPATIFASVP